MHIHDWVLGVIVMIGTWIITGHFTVGLMYFGLSIIIFAITNVAWHTKRIEMHLSENKIKES